MITTEQVDTSSKAHVRRFVELPYRLYRQHPQWVPPLRIDMEIMLNKKKQPFYEHSDADFFIAARGGRAHWAADEAERGAGRVQHLAARCGTSMGSRSSVN